MDKKITLFILFVFVFLSCRKELEEVNPISDIMFIGSSFTEQLSPFIDSLVASNRDSIYIKVRGIGNGSFTTHCNSRTIEFIAGNFWNCYVLQEAGYKACLSEDEFEKSTYPYAEIIIDTIRKLNPDAKICLFMTQAYQYGESNLCPNDSVVCTYDGMQDRIIENYIRLAKKYNLEIAPVGYYWRIFSNLYQSIKLFHPDTFHGSYEGRYLSACIIYAVIFNKSPLGTQVPQKVTEDNALIIQQFVDKYVFEDKKWEALYNSVE